MDETLTTFLQFILPSAIGISASIVVAVLSSRNEARKAQLQADDNEEKNRQSASEQINSLSLKWVTEFKLAQDKAEAKLLQHEQEMDKLKEEMNQRLRQNELEISTLKMDNASLQLDNKRLQADLDKVRTDNQKLQTELEEVRRISRDQADRIQSLEEENRVLKGKKDNE